MTDYCVFRAYELNVFSVHVQLYAVYNCTQCTTVLSVRLYSVYDCTHCKTVLIVKLYAMYSVLFTGCMVIVTSESINMSNH